VVYVNLWLGLCWILFVLRHEFQSYLDKIGMRGIYINSLLMSLAYVVPLGVFPVYVFGKNIQQNDESESAEGTPHADKAEKDARMSPNN
jgi:hypothetical protein